MGARIRIPLRVLLACLAVILAAIGAVAVGLAEVSATRGYLMRQADDGLLACARSVLSQGFVAAPGSDPVPGQLPPGACDMELLSVSGQSLTPAAPGTAAGPALPAGGSWLAAHLSRPVTVPGTGATGRWRVVLEAVRYQPQRILYVYGPDNVRYVVSGRTGHGPGGVLVAMTGLAGIGRITERVAAGYAVAAGAVLVLLAGAGLAMTRAILQPLREASRLAGAAGPVVAGELPYVLPRRGIRAGEERNRWPFGMALMRMSARMRASRTVEAAARRSAAEMVQRLAEVSRDMRMSVNVVRGSAEYYQQRGRPLPADLDRMMRRVADEAARMETLIEDLARLSEPRGQQGMVAPAGLATDLSSG
jgi:signal transduction histidine kinase